MKNFNILIISIFSTLASLNAFAQTAEVKTAVKSCTETSYTTVGKRRSVNYSDRWSWDGYNTESEFSTGNASTRKNLSDSSCQESDISTWMTSLKNNCSTYFNVISFSPLTKGYSEYIWKDKSATEEDHSGGIGYSYTDRLVLVYHCL